MSHSMSHGRKKSLECRIEDKEQLGNDSYR